MMKLSMIAIGAVFSLFSFSAQAVNVSQDAAGQVLLYPYYNVNQGNVTFVSVTNATNVSKAVKVRFREGVGGERVFDFMVYLPPRDVWVGAVARRSGAVRLSVPVDTTCTVPDTATLTATDFSSARIDSAYDPDDDGMQSADEVLERLSEGHIELIELAELPYTAGASDVAHAIKHDRFANPVAPIDCSVAVAFSSAAGLGAILDAGEVTAGGFTQDFQSPGGGLFGSAAIFNAASGVYFPYNATALKEFAANPVWWPQNDEVFTRIEGVATDGEDSAGNAISNYRTADNGSTVPSTGGTLNRDLPDLSTPSMAEVTADSSAYTAFTHVAASGAQAINSGSFGGSVPNAQHDKASAVGAALTANTIRGEYLTTGDYTTDWVITLPTRYAKVSDSGVSAPFSVLEVAVSGQACHGVSFDHWNRKENKNSGDINFLVPPLPAPTFCYAANVTSLNENREYSFALSSKAIKRDVPLEFADGWSIMGLSAHTVTPTVLNAGDASGDVVGLPVIGFSAVADMVSGTERGGVFPFRVLADEQ